MEVVAILGGAPFDTPTRFTISNRYYFTVLLLVIAWRKLECGSIKCSPPHKPRHKKLLLTQTPSERNRNKHIICLTHKYLQDIYQPYRRNQQNGSNTWESQKFPTNSYSRRTCHKNNTKTINKTQTNHTSTRNSNPASIWGLLRPSVSPSKPPFLYLPRPITNNRRHP